MSYARFCDHSDVYIYSDGEAINCCGCRLDSEDFASDDFDEICEHLIRHLDAGHQVPRYCIERLLDEAISGMWGKEPCTLPPDFVLPPGGWVELIRRMPEEPEDESAE
jgi:hypothetical protein